MYKYNHSKILKLLVGIIIIFMRIGNHTIGFDLAEQIYSKFNDIKNKGYGDVFLTNAYSPNLSKDPYGEALSSIKSRSAELNVAGAQYVENLLKQKGCSNLTQKEIWGTLYYFVPEFRAELSRDLKQSIGNYDSKQYVFTDGEIAQYCGKFYDCNNFDNSAVSSECKGIKDECDKKANERESKKKDCESKKKDCESKKKDCESKKKDCENKKDESYDNCLKTCYAKISSSGVSRDCRGECKDKYESKECSNEYNKCNNEYNKCNNEYNKCNNEHTECNNEYNQYGNEYSKCINDWKLCEAKNIKADNSSSSVMDVCKEFFESNYRLGQDNKKNIQNVADSQIGAERYWNNSTEDSPYDIMVDLDMLAKLLYRDAQDPIITPTFYKTAVSYKMPNFGNATKQGSKGDASTVSDENQVVSDGGGEKVGYMDGDISLDGGQSLEDKKGLENQGDIEGKKLNGETSLNRNEGSKSTSIVQGNSVEQTEESNTNQLKGLSDYDGDGGYDELVEGLNILGLKSKDSKIFSNLCEDDELVEPDELGQSGLPLDEDEEDAIKFSDLSDEEYQDIIDSMMDAVDKYATLPSDVEDKIKKGASSRNSGIINSTTPEELEEAANKIKNCYSSCEGLRIDQKASCMLKCSCGEVESPIFDPSKTPGLGPIFVIRFCGVPATSTSFSVGGKRIYSIEEGLYEIYGALDKLSREGKLGTWTQQNEFLDSSTKKMNIAKTFAFSISVEFVNIANNMGKKKATNVESVVVTESEYEKKARKDINDYWLSNYGIMNDLTDASSKNAYLVIGDGGKVSTVGQEKSLSVNEKTESEDLSAEANADRYGLLEEYLYEFIEQQSNLWGKVITSISDLNGKAQYLYKKKCSK